MCVEVVVHAFDHITEVPAGAKSYRKPAILAVPRLLGACSNQPNLLVVVVVDRWRIRDVLRLKRWVKAIR